MTDDQADYLDFLAASVRSLSSEVDRLRRVDLEARLDPGGRLFEDASGLMPRATFAGDDIARTLGNILPVNQQTNMLHDPSFENMNSPAAVGTAPTVIGQYLDQGDVVRDAWTSLRTATSMTGTIGITTSRQDQNHNPFHTTAVSMRCQPTGSGTHDLVIYSAPITMTKRQTWGELPYLVGAIKVGTLRAAANTYTNVTSRTVIVSLFNQTDSTTLAAQEFDLAGFADGALGQVIALSCAGSPVEAKDYVLVVTLRVVASGSGGDLMYFIGEPQLQLSATPDPGPFTPAVAGWVPNKVFRSTDDAGFFTGVERVLAAQIYGDSVPRVHIQTSGAIRWGSGAAASDVGISRVGTSLLRVAGKLDVTGALTAATMPAMASIPFVLVTGYGGSANTEMKFSDSAISVVGRVPMPWAGSVVGLSVHTTSNRTAGTATMHPLINGSVDTTIAAVLNGTNVADATGTGNRGFVPFAAGDTIGARILTSAWTPLAADLYGVVYVVFDAVT